MALTKDVFKHTQQQIADEFGYSLSTVSHALRVPAQIGAIRKESKFFVLQDFQKLLYYWASMRDLTRDVVYSTRIEQPVRDIESMAISQSIFACYTAARMILEEPPADYAAVYWYVKPEDLPAFKKRFPTLKGVPNVFALRMPAVMPHYGQITTVIQTFVDIWNLPHWYSRDFTSALEQHINAILS